MEACLKVIKSTQLKYVKYVMLTIMYLAIIRGLMHKVTVTILDFQVVNLGSASYHRPSLASAFAQFERSKNRKHKCLICMQHRRDFAPFIASCTGNLGPHAKKVLQRLSQCLAEKWYQPYSSVAHYVNSRISISLVRSTSHCLRGS